MPRMLDYARQYALISCVNKEIAKFIRVGLIAIEKPVHCPGLSLRVYNDLLIA